MPKNNRIMPEPHAVTEFLRGQASRIFRDVSENDKAVVVIRNSKPENVIISYKEYLRLIGEQTESKKKEGKA